jgi:hypothetical protein
MATTGSRITNVPRPAARAAPQLICLPTEELQDVPPPKPPSVPPPLPPHRPSQSVPRGGPNVAALFDGLVSLGNQADSLSAARLCLDVLAAVIPCRALIVHAFDVTRRDFLVVHARGESAECMVLSRHRSTDPLLRVAMPTGGPFTWKDLRRAPVHSLARFSELHGVRTILLAPVVSGPRWLGAIELVDPAGGGGFRGEDEAGARYVANRYAEFLTTHRLVLDIGTVARFANA